MEEKRNVKIITLFVCIAVLIASVFALGNQIRLKAELEEIMQNMTNSSAEFEWAEDDSDEIIDYHENLAENTAVENDERKDISTSSASVDTQKSSDYLIINTNSKKIHYPDCRSVSKISENNIKIISNIELEAYIESGYSFCSICSGE